MKLNILIIAFNRYDTLKILLKSLESINRSNIFFFIDGPRNNDDSDIQKNIIELAKKSQIEESNIFNPSVNLGINVSIPKAIDWAFSTFNLDNLLILEDDCIPSIEGIQTALYLAEKGLENKGIITLNNYFEKLTNTRRNPCAVSLKIPIIWGWYVSRDIWKKINIEYTYRSLPKYSEIIWGSNMVFNSFFFLKRFITAFYHKKFNRYWGTWDNYMSLSARKEKVPCYTIPYNAIANIGHVGSNTASTISDRNFERPHGKLKADKKMIITHNGYKNFAYSTLLSVIYFFPATIKLFLFALKCMVMPNRVKHKNYL